MIGNPKRHFTTPTWVKLLELVTPGSVSGNNYYSKHNTLAYNQQQRYFHGTFNVPTVHIYYPRRIILENEHNLEASRDKHVFREGHVATVT